MDGAATKLQAIQRGKNSAKEVEAKKAEIEEKKEMDGAATKLQAIQRGKNATKEVEAKKAEIEEEGDGRCGDQAAGDPARQERDEGS